LRVHSRCLEIIADEVQNCASLEKVYGKEIGDIHPAPCHEVHVQSILFAGLRASGYFTMAGANYFDDRSSPHRQVDLAVWLSDVPTWLYLEIKECEPQGGRGKVLEDARKLKEGDKSNNPRDQLRAVLAYGFKYGKPSTIRYQAKFEKVSKELEEEWKFEKIAIDHRSLAGQTYSCVQVGLWAIGLQEGPHLSGDGTGNPTLSSRGRS
jgi:hypothetical protein